MGLEAAKSTKSSLAPGFRFHPTDEELVRYYLRRKICGKPFRFDAISDLDIYKVEPWDLPGKSRLKSRDLEWYFFTLLDKKYGNGSRTNRATDGGYWKTTGKDRAVYHRTKIVGMKKTLVYHSGRAPRGERTNWVMHEYRLIDEEMEKAGILHDAFVLCRIFRKSGSGPKNGEQYGAPFIDEEWEEEDELVMVPKNEFAEELPVNDDAFSDACLDENDIEQILNAADSSHQAPIPLNPVYDDEYQYLEGSENFNEENQEISVGVDGNYLVHEQPDGTTLFNLPVQSDMDITVKHEYIGEPSYSGDVSNTENPVDVNYLLDEPYLDALDNPQFAEGSFIETNDLKPSVEADPSSFEMLDEYLQYFDSTDGNYDYSGFDYSNMLESEDLPSDPASLLSQEVIPKDVNEDIKQETVEETHLPEVPSDDVSSPSRPAQPEFGSDFQYPFTSRGSRMLGNIPAPPAFASEYPRKDAALHFNSASPSSIRVTAGIIQIQNTSLRGTGISWSFGKDGRLSVTFSFSLSRDDNYSADTATAISMLPDKSNSALYRGWFYFMCMWVLFLTMSFKIGSYICAK